MSYTVPNVVNTPLYPPPPRKSIAALDDKRSLLAFIGRGGGGGRTHLLLALFYSPLTIDHASLSRPSTVPTPSRDLQRSGAHHASSIYCVKTVL